MENTNTIEDKTAEGGGDLATILRSKAVYHPGLKVIAIDGGKADGCEMFMDRMMWYLVNKSEESKEKLHDLREGLKYIVDYANLKGLFMILFKGYQEI